MHNSNLVGHQYEIKTIKSKSKHLGNFPPKCEFIVGGANQQFVLCEVILLFWVTKCKKIGRSESHLMPVINSIQKQ